MICLGREINKPWDTHKKVVSFSHFPRSSGRESFFFLHPFFCEEKSQSPRAPSQRKKEEIERRDLVHTHVPSSRPPFDYGEIEFFTGQQFNSYNFVIVFNFFFFNRLVGRKMRFFSDLLAPPDGTVLY